VAQTFQYLATADFVVRSALRDTLVNMDLQCLCTGVQTGLLRRGSCISRQQRAAEGSRGPELFGRLGHGLISQEKAE
jgi:hypothetical protein